MKKLLLLTIFLLSAIASHAQFGSIIFNQDTARFVRRVVLNTIYNGATTDSLLTHKINGNLGRLHMNQLVLPFANLSNKPTTILTYGITDAYTKTETDNAYEPKFTKNTAFNKNFGTASNTVTEGNDSRVVNGQTAFTWGNHALVGYLTGITGPMIASALGYTPVPNSRTINSYPLTSNITLVKGDIGLGNVDNTSDLNKPISTATQTALDTKQATLVSGTNIKTVNGNSLLGSGNLNLKPSIPYSGTTNASGLFTVTFGTAYASTPNIQANIINGSDTQNIRTTSVSTTGFTVLVRNRVDVVGLLPSWQNVNGASVHILITEV